MSSSPRCANRCVPAHVSGFSLLEVLISLVIVAVGLLGVAGLMSNTLKNNDSAAMRSQATLQAYNIIDRMRTNMTGVNNLNYVVSMPASATTSVLPSGCTGFGAGCNSAATATYDIAQWEYELAKLLPQGRGSISTVPSAGTNPGNYTVTVLWNDSRANQALGGAPAATTFSLVVSSSF